MLLQQIGKCYWRAAVIIFDREDGKFSEAWKGTNLTIWIRREEDSFRGNDKPVNESLVSQDKCSNTQIITLTTHTHTHIHYFTAGTVAEPAHLGSQAHPISSYPRITTLTLTLWQAPANGPTQLARSQHLKLMGPEPGLCICHHHVAIFRILSCPRPSQKYTHECTFCPSKVQVNARLVHNASLASMRNVQNTILVV